MSGCAPQLISHTYRTTKTPGHNPCPLTHRHDAIISEPCRTSSRVGATTGRLSRQNGCPGTPHRVFAPQLFQYRQTFPPILHYRHTSATSCPCLTSCTLRDSRPQLFLYLQTSRAALRLVSSHNYGKLSRAVDHLQARSHTLKPT